MRNKKEILEAIEFYQKLIKDTRKQMKEYGKELDPLYAELKQIRDIPSIGNVYNSLFESRIQYYPNSSGSIQTSKLTGSSFLADKMNHLTTKDAKATVLYAMWKNIAAYVEGGKRYKFRNGHDNYQVIYEADAKRITIWFEDTNCQSNEVIYFSSGANAEKALSIFGERNLRLMSEF